MDVAARTKRPREAAAESYTVNGSMSERDWPSEDISVLTALLSEHGDDKAIEEQDGRRVSNGETWASSAPGETNELVVTALRRQVELLQQEYDRFLEQRVAQSVVAAGGKTTTRAPTIKLYRQFERLARVAESLVSENQRLAALLLNRQLQQQQCSASQTATGAAPPFRIPRTTAPLDFLLADPKERLTPRSDEREDMPWERTASSPTKKEKN